MPTASIELPDGTKITVDGAVEEVEKIIKAYVEASKGSGNAAPKKQVSRRKTTVKHASTQSEAEETTPSNDPDYAGIVNRVHDCHETDAIEKEILDKRDVLNRVLLPIYIVHKYFDDDWELSSGDIEKITNDLKVKVHISAASRTLSGSGKKYLQADSVRKKGSTVRYKLNRKGVQHMEKTLSVDE